MLWYGDVWRIWFEFFLIDITADHDIVQHTSTKNISGIALLILVLALECLAELDLFLLDTAFRFHMVSESKLIIGIIVVVHNLIIVQREEEARVAFLFLRITIGI